jgi:DNA-binding NarL/FixJ family response regulator
VIRVLLAEDHAVVRTGLEQLFATTDDIDVVATGADGHEAVLLAEEHQPDVVLMDLEMPRLDGRQATERIVSARPEVRVVILTSFSDRERILDALDAGAVGYLLKDAEPDELIRGVRAAARGESPLAPKAAHSVLEARSQARPAVQLTPREQEILDCLAAGLPNKQIARRLGISEKTVKAHVTRIFHALGVTDRTQAALWAQRHGSG